MALLSTKFGRTVCVAAACLLASGCATTHGNPDDPLEGYNRAMFAFNERLDKAVTRPLAEGYKTITPVPVRTGISNFFGNLGDIWIGFNNLLQGKIREAASDVSRVLVNSTMGLLGFIDVASDMGLEKHDEDFGQTLGRWGVGPGPYFVVPFFGPRTLRDTAALPLDLTADSFWMMNPVAARNELTGLRIVSDRAALLGLDRTLEEGTLDKYSYARDFYLQQRRYKVFDGHPPRERFDDESRDSHEVQADVTASAAVGRLDLARIGNGETRQLH